MTEQPDREPGHRRGRHRGLYRIVRTPDLPAEVNAMVSAEGVIYLRTGLERAAARKALRGALAAVHRFPGVMVLPVLAGSRLRYFLHHVAAIWASAGTSLQMASQYVSDNVVSSTVVAIAIVVASTGAVVTVASTADSGAGGTPGGQFRTFSAQDPVVAALPPVPLAYLGAYEPDAPGSYAGMTGFAQAAGQVPNLAMYYSGWGESFQVQFADDAAANGAWPLVQWEPDGTSLAWIASGGSDAYITAFADAVGAFGHPVVIAFAHEMNGSWTSWGAGHVPQATWIAAWQHIVDVFRGQGADNVTWLWDVSSTAGGPAPCGWWPGSQYVTWVGIDGYYEHPGDSFATIFAPTIAQVRECTGDPVLIAETAAGQDAGQLQAVEDLFAEIRGSGYLGFVWFDQDQSDGPNHQQWRLETDPPDVGALFRQETAGWRLNRKSQS